MKKAEGHGKSQEFQRFEKLAGKLAAVPKKEVDKQMAKYEREKGKSPVNK